jgi:hypothetical protein
MRRTEAFQDVGMAVFLNLLRRWESAELNRFPFGATPCTGHDIRKALLTSG